MINTLTAPVAVFDSGVGGIGVLREIQKLLPHENLLYFGDNARAPYGNRDPDEIRALVLTHARRLLDTAKALVLACNTATAVAVTPLRERYPTVPIVGMEPAVKPALHVTDHPRILILATAATLREQKLAQLLERFRERAAFDLCAASGLVSLVEGGLADSERALDYLKVLLAPFSGNRRPDAVVLGCTHFPFAARTISRALGADIPLFDGALGTAKELAHRLRDQELLNPQKSPGQVTVTSSDPHALALCQRLLYG